MAKQIFVNLPVSDLERSTAFYEALGFTKNTAYSNDQASAMVWSDEIYVMLLRHDFYKQFIQSRTIADTASTSAVLLALSLDSKEAVEQFAETAKKHGGNSYRVDMGAPEDQMYGLEVQDPDGNMWEPVWMSPDFMPHEN